MEGHDDTHGADGKEMISNTGVANVRNPATKYGLTVAAVLAAAIIRWLLDPLLGDSVPYATFFAAVAFSAWIGGLRTGLMATILGCFFALFLFVPPRFSLLGTTGPHLVGSAIYIAVSLTITGFGEAMWVAQRRYADQKERLRTTLASIGDAVITTDVDGRVTSMNAVAESLTAWTTTEAVGVPLAQVFNIVNEETRKPVDNPATRALKEGVIVGLANHTVLIAKDGTERPIDDSAAPIRCKEGKVVGCVLVFRDISERQRHEVELRERTAQFDFALASAGVGLWLNPLPFGDLNWDARTRELFCVPIGERPTIELFWSGLHPDDREPTRLAVEVAMRDRTRYDIDHRVVNPDTGEIRWVRSAGQATYNEDGVATRFDGVSQDITDRKQTEERLRKSEARLRRVFESNVVAMIRWDLDRSLILDANAEFLRMTGYTRDDVVSGRLNFRDLTPAEWTARNEQGVRTIRTEGHAAPYEKEYFRKDGSRAPFIIAGTRFEDSPSEGMSFLIDISDAKRAEADLRASEQRLRLVVESATDYAIFTMNTEGIIEGWNAGAERLFGYSEAEVVGQHDHFLYTPEDAALKIPEREMKKAAAEGRAVNERWHARKGGDRFWGSGLVQPLRDGESIVGFLKIMRDMTEQREYEERLRQAEEQFRTLADNMSQFAWTADEKGWIYWYNRRWYEYTGTTLEEMKGWGWKAVHHPDHVERVVKRIQHSWDTGELWEDTFPLRGVDGNYRWFLSRAVPIRDDEGRILRWFGTNTDITEQRELQQALLDADRRKDEFLATLAHELRNPLAPIRNGLQLMRLAGRDSEAVEHARTMMDRQLGQMVRLVDDLMDVSRITRGKLELKRERVQLAAVVNSAIETSRPLIEQMGHELIVLMPTQPIVVDADLTRLAQVFLNLLNNAAKYSDRSGQIRLTAERQGSDVVVAVKDNGIGIAADQLPYIFEMFTQVDRSLEKAQGGLGIGLTLVRRLVEMHGGRVEAHSDGSGKGSEFVVRLPLVVEASVPSKAHEQHEGNMKSTLRILIVDDNRDSADSLAMMLKVMGNDTHTAYDGEEAVALANEFRPAVILLDIGLPKINGYEACRRIRAQRGGEKLVIIAQTGWGQDEDRQRTHEAGFDHHMVKPVDPTALMKMLAELQTSTN